MKVTSLRGAEKGGENIREAGFATWSLCACGQMEHLSLSLHTPFFEEALKKKTVIY